PTSEKVGALLPTDGNVPATSIGLPPRVTWLMLLCSGNASVMTVNAPGHGRAREGALRKKNLHAESGSDRGARVEMHDHQLGRVTGQAGCDRRARRHVVLRPQH